MMKGMRSMEFCHVTAMKYTIDEFNGHTNAVITLRVADQASTIQGTFDVEWPNTAYNYAEFLVESR